MKVSTIKGLLSAFLFLSVLSLSLTVIISPSFVYAGGDDGGGDSGGGDTGGDTGGDSGTGSPSDGGNPTTDVVERDSCSGCIQYDYSCASSYCGDVPEGTLWDPNSNEWVIVVDRSTTPGDNGDSGNNGDSNNPPPATHPNLLITSISIPTSPPNQTVNASVTVQNNDSGSTGSGFQVALEIRPHGLSPSGSGCSLGANDAVASLNTLGAGQSVTVQIPITVSSDPGSYTLYGMADSDCGITESDESDNWNHVDFTISTPAPTVTACIVGQDNGCPAQCSNQSLYWSSTDASSCTVTQTGWTGTSGCHDTGNPGSSQSYTVSCSGPGGSGSGSANLQCPANTGSICTTSANACGMTNSGIIRCDGSCSVSAPPSNASCPTPNITMSGNPISSCAITWNATQVTSCTMVGPGISTSGVSGTVHTPNSNTQGSYLLTCYNGPAVYTAKTFICHANPQYQEF